MVDNTVANVSVVVIFYLVIGFYAAGMSGSTEFLSWLFFWPLLVAWRAWRGLFRAFHE